MKKQLVITLSSPAEIKTIKELQLLTLCKTPKEAIIMMSNTYNELVKEYQKLSSENKKR